MQAELAETGVRDWSLKSAVSREHCDTTKAVIKCLHGTGLYVTGYVRKEVLLMT